MKIVLTGSLGHISRPLAESLIAAGHNVTVISHNPQRAAQISALGATPAIGSMSDLSFLITTFSGADAVYLMITNATGGNGDLFTAGQQQAATYAKAVKNADIKNVVNLSSVGANLGPEVGALHIYNVIENVLTHDLPSVNLTFLRPTGMFYNLFSSMPSIKQDHAIYTNNSLTKRGSWVSPTDIVPIAAKALTTPQSGITNQYIASDEKSYTEIATILGDALDIPDRKAVQIDDDTMTRNLLASGMPADFTTQYVKMLAYERDHNFYADYQAHHPVLGPTKLTDFAVSFARAYQQA